MNGRAGVEGIALRRAPGRDFQFRPERGNFCPVSDMLPISQVGRKYGLSRSTLLYYDRLRLVRPSYRTAAGYRLYAAAD